MRITAATQSGSQAYAGVLDGSMAAKKAQDANASLAGFKSMGDSYQALTQAADKLKAGKFKDEKAYASALQGFTQAYNQTFSASKSVGGVAGRQVQQALGRVASQLQGGAAKSGFNVDKQGNLQVDENTAQAAYKASPTKATEVFASGVTSRLDQAGAPIRQTVDHETKRLQTEIDHATQQQVMINKASSILGATYGAQGEFNQLTGPSAIYQMM